MVIAPALYLPQSFFGLPLYIGVELVLGIAIINKLAGLYGILSLITGHPLDFSQWIYYLSSVAVIPFYIIGLMNIKSPNLGTFSLVSLIYLGDTFFAVLFLLHFAAQWFGAVEAEVAEDSLKNSTAAATATPSIKPSVPPPRAIAASATSSSKFSSSRTAASKSSTTTPILDYEIESPDEDDMDDAIDLNYVKRFAYESVNLIARSDVSSQSASKTYELMTTIITSLVVMSLRFYFLFVLLSFTRLLLKSKKYGVDSEDFNDRKNDHLIEDSGRLRKWVYAMESKAADIVIWMFRE